MTRLPRVTGRQVVRALERAGFEIVRIIGSHHFLVDEIDPTRRATIPVHAGQMVPLPVMRNILRTARLSIEDFRKLL